MRRQVGLRIATLLAIVFLCSVGSAWAADVVLNTPNSFRTLAAGDGDGDNTTYTVTGNLTMASGSNITCNDNAADQPPGPVAPNASACPIKIVVTGNMEMAAGSAIRAENNGAGGNGGDITITVGGNLTLLGTAGATPGAVISSSKTSGAGDTGVAGNITVNAGNFGANPPTGGILTEPGSSILANGPGPAGHIVLNGARDIDIDGLVESKGSSTTGRGGRITVDAGCFLIVTDAGKISSRGQDPGADRVHLEAGCDVTIYGLVESTGPGHIVPPANSCHDPSRPDKPANSAACVEVWSGGTLTIDSNSPHNGEINADVAQSGGTSGRGWIDLFALLDINLKGAGSGAFVAHANAGPGTNRTGGFVTTKSTRGTVTASLRALQASAPGAGGDGGVIVVEALDAVNLNTATLEAKGAALGGDISVRSFTSSVSWQNGNGDVRPNASGTITLTSCSALPGGVNTTGTNFNGEIPAKFGGSCDLNGPVLPDYVQLPVCVCITIDDCPVCVGALTVDKNVTVNFNPTTPTCNDGHVAADDSLCDYFTPDKSGGATADKWLAVFDLGQKKLVVNSGVTITTNTVPISGNALAPGISIKSCELDVQLGAKILVASVNRNAGPILIEVQGNITINGTVKDSVTGTLGLPGDIVISSCCGSITTGPQSLIETAGVDPGGSDIVITTCCDGKDVTINGLVFAHAHAHVIGGPKPDIRVAAFNAGVTINSGTAPVLDDFNLNGTRFDFFAGLLSLVEKCDATCVPGRVEVQAAKDIVVVGHGNDTTGSVFTSFAAVAAGTITNSSVGGWVDVRSLGGKITGTNRAFQSFGRIHNGSSLINLGAAGNIALSRPGAASTFNPVVDSFGDVSGGTNVIRSFAGGISITPPALVTANVGGSNSLTYCTSVSAPAGTVTPAPAIAQDCTQQAPAPLFIDCDDPALDPQQRTISCVCDVAQVGRRSVPWGVFANLQVMACEDPRASRVLFY